MEKQNEVLIDFSNANTKAKFDDSLFCRFGETDDPDCLKGKWKDRYVLFFSDLSEKPFPITKSFLKWNHLDRQEVIEKAYPKKDRVLISEYKGESTARKPDYVVCEERCGAAVLLLDAVFVKLSREQNLLLAAKDDEVWVYRLNGAGPLSIREKAKALEIAGSMADSSGLYYYDALNEEIHRLKVD